MRNIPIAKALLFILISLVAAVFVVAYSARAAVPVTPVPAGGTASSTLSGILKGNGTSPVQTAIPGTDYQGPIGIGTNLIVGTIGVGTTSPLQKLHVNGNIGLQMDATDATVAGYASIYGYKNIGANAIRPEIRFTNTNTMRLYSQAFPVPELTLVNTDVGVGSTTPWAKLSVHGNTTDIVSGEVNRHLFAVASSTNTSTSTLFTIENTGFVTSYGSLATGATSTSEQLRLTRPIFGGVAYPQSASFLLGSYAANSAANSFGPSTRLDINLKAGVGLSEAPDTNIMSLLANQTVGIASTSPYARLSVHANNGDTNRNLFAVGSSTQTATSTLFTVTNSGNVGIGVNFPSTQLHVAAVSAAGEMTPVILQNVSNANGAATSLGFSQNATLTGPLTGKLSSIRNSAASFDMALYSSTGAGTVTEGLRLTSARNLGVGSTSPMSKLTVHANNGDTNQYLFSIGSSTQSATSTLLVIDNMGNVGIGTTSPFADFSIHANVGDPNTTLFAIGSTSPTGTVNTNFSIDSIGTVHIKGGGSAYTNIGQFTGGSSFGGIGFATTPGVVNATGYSMIGDGSNTYLNAPTSGSMYFRQGNQERMFLNSSGNFGIGTTSPIQKLHVNGSIALQMDATDASNAGYASIGGYKNLGANALRPEIRFMNTNSMRLYSSGVSAMPEVTLVNSAVGIGSTTPRAKLGVHGLPSDAVAYQTLFAVASSTNTATTTLYLIDNVGHEYTGGPTPTLSAGTFVNAANDSSGTVTTASGAGTTFTLTFAQPWLTPPACNANFATTTSAIAIDTTTTAAVFTYPSVNNVKLHYQCRNSI